MIEIVQERKGIYEEKKYTCGLCPLDFCPSALLSVGLLLIYPIFSSLYYSMTTKHLIRLTYDFVGLENYKAVLSDSNFYKAFFNSLLWTAGSLLGQLAVGFTAALAINRVKAGKGVYRTLMIIPWAFPSIVIALSWKWILNGVSGFVPNMLVQLGICSELPQFLSDSSLVFFTLIFINIWFGAPMIMVNVLSALQTIPRTSMKRPRSTGRQSCSSSGLSQYRISRWWWGC